MHLIWTIRMHVWSQSLLLYWACLVYFKRDAIQQMDLVFKRMLPLMCSHNCLIYFIQFIYSNADDAGVLLGSVLLWCDVQKIALRKLCQIFGFFTIG